MKLKTILCAPDSFKESMSAEEACNAMEKGIKAIDPSIRVIKMPMADGGEGTLDALISSTQGRIHSTRVQDPLGNLIMARYGISGDQKTAVMEMAEASGLARVPFELRNPLLTSTFGTGQLIQACLNHNIEQLLIGIGGSATNDGGSGALEALGVVFYDEKHQVIKMNGQNLSLIETIDISALDARVKKVKIDVACDVTNTLCGEWGASYVYGPQKGGTVDMIKILDENLLHFAHIIKKDLDKDVLDIKGGGAAGGLGMALSVFLEAKLQKGIDLVLHHSHLEEKLEGVDLVLTAEGKMDEQTQFGKTPMGVCLTARQKGIPVIAFCGQKGQGVDELFALGFQEILQISDESLDLKTALENGVQNLELKVKETIKRLLI